MKRHASLVGLSRDHHHALVLAKRWRDTATEDLGAGVVAAARRDFSRALEPHFEVEERVLVPAAVDAGGPAKAHAEDVLAQHRDLRQRLNDLSEAESPGALAELGRALEEHVRFEERVWFASIQAALDASALDALTLRLVPRPVGAIERFEWDGAEDAWVAQLACGHTQHVRHEPPWQNRAWVETKEGRRDHLGVSLPCVWCRMPKLPAGARVYRQTDTFDAESVPAGLLATHRLKLGTWGEIIVRTGRVIYVIEDEDPLSLTLTPERSGVVAPERPHHVELGPGAEFFVRFLRELER